MYTTVTAAVYIYTCRGYIYIYIYIYTAAVGPLNEDYSYNHVQHFHELVLMCQRAVQYLRRGLFNILRIISYYLR